MEEKILKLLENLTEGVNGLREDLRETNRKLDRLEERMDKLESRMDKLESRMDKLESRMDKLESEVGLIKEQVKENTEILRALEHASEVHKAEIDKLTYDVAEMAADVKAIRKDFSLVEEITAKNWNEIIQIKKNIKM
ncbi:hypothetical protein PWK10_09525 [Caloramator sp. Dgby_cultured_2]|uniref:hypothetical protein n=1 Tax=Caloramator sp. Dgby_cultured_2 TaxID=3029174 RepID=UPI00237D4616|nr:hypothetical protein [Caloramator sp. Dgby_cultured_2]WDU84532.1 hypothetical protein PWK10_09525 [Caloramator sp. Dgby_cultured_2]